MTKAEKKGTTKIKQLVLNDLGKLDYNIKMKCALQMLAMAPKDRFTLNGFLMDSTSTIESTTASEVMQFFGNLQDSINVAGAVAHLYFAKDLGPAAVLDDVCAQILALLLNLVEDCLTRMKTPSFLVLINAKHNFVTDMHSCSMWLENALLFGTSARDQLTQWWCDNLRGAGDKLKTICVALNGICDNDVMKPSQCFSTILDPQRKVNVIKVVGELRFIQTEVKKAYSLFRIDGGDPAHKAFQAQLEVCTTELGWGATWMTIIAACSIVLQGGNKKANKGDKGVAANLLARAALVIDNMPPTVIPGILKGYLEELKAGRDLPGVITPATQEEVAEPTNHPVPEPAQFEAVGASCIAKSAPSGPPPGLMGPKSTQSVSQKGKPVVPMSVQGSESDDSVSALQKLKRKRLPTDKTIITKPTAKRQPKIATAASSKGT